MSFGNAMLGAEPAGALESITWTHYVQAHSCAHAVAEASEVGRIRRYSRGHFCTLTIHRLSGKRLGAAVGAIIEC